MNTEQMQYCQPIYYIDKMSIRHQFALIRGTYRSIKTSNLNFLESNLN